ncbi:MAG TPA: PH domain-containing protein [Bryobacteraceae bacterium]|nr:PH domain-containing protein [Bryobacteraceae bacterium]
MSDLTIRPTAKFINAGFVLVVLIIIALDVAYFKLWRDQGFPTWFPFVPLVLLLWPVSRAIRRRFNKAVVTGDRLRYEVGATSKTTRNIQLTKVQDIRVDQGIFQRMMNIGNISIETSGETSRLTIPNVDRPQQICDELLNRSQSGTPAA